MDFNAFKALVFSAVAEHDGDWSWYQLDRHLARTWPEMMGDLMPALRQLEAEGRIRPVPSGENPGMPRYMLSSTES